MDDLVGWQVWVYSGENDSIQGRMETLRSGKRAVGRPARTESNTKFVSSEVGRNQEEGDLPRYYVKNDTLSDEYQEIKSFLGDNYYEDQTGLNHIEISNDTNVASNIFDFLGW